jgi:hypothetical protein
MGYVEGAARQRRWSRGPAVARLAPVLRKLGCGLGALACSNSEPSTPSEAPASSQPITWTNCENTVTSDRPCPGLLPTCNRSPPRSPDYLSIFGFSTCTDEHLHESVTIIRAAPLLQVAFESGCRAQVEFDARQRFLDLPSLGAGNQVDAELWHPSADLQDPQLWLILKRPDTGELLFTLYQKPWELIEDGVVQDTLGFGVALTEPTCEDFDPSSLDLYHKRALRLTTQQPSVELGKGDVAPLSLPNGQQIVVQGGELIYGYTHLMDATLLGSESHMRVGSYARFAAWSR